jgi:hypothetical protein
MNGPIRCVLVSAIFFCVGQQFAVAQYSGQDPRIYWLLRQAAMCESAAKTPMTPLPWEQYYLNQAACLRWQANYLAYAQNCAVVQAQMYAPAPATKSKEPDAATEVDRETADREKERRHAEVEAERVKTRAAEAALDRERADREREKRHAAELELERAKTRAAEAALDRERADREREKRRAAELAAERAKRRAAEAELRAALQNVKPASAAEVPSTGDPVLDTVDRQPERVKLAGIAGVVVLAGVVVSLTFGVMILVGSYHLAYTWLSNSLQRD